MARRSGIWLLLAGMSLSTGCQVAKEPGAGEVAPESLKGKWVLESLQGEKISEQSHAFIQFSEPPRLTGNGGCNRFFGVYRYESDALLIDSALGSTKMACAPQVMVEEQRLFQLLPRAVGVEKVADNELVLSGRDGVELIRVRRMPQP